MSVLLSEDRERLSGFATVAAVCAAVFVRVPSATVVENVRAVGTALGLRWFDGIEASPELEQRYYDRLFVSSHPAFVPLHEDCVRGGYEERGRFRFGKTDGRFCEHVLGCYRAVGFDYRLIEGFAPAISALKPDSLASELAFSAFLAQQALLLEESDPPAACRAVTLLAEFSRDHSARWFFDAAACLERFEDDFYARAALLAADAAQTMAEGEGAF